MHRMSASRKQYRCHHPAKGDNVKHCMKKQCQQGVGRRDVKKQPVIGHDTVPVQTVVAAGVAAGVGGGGGGACGGLVGVVAWPALTRLRRGPGGDKGEDCSQPGLTPNRQSDPAALQCLSCTWDCRAWCGRNRVSLTSNVCSQNGHLTPRCQSGSTTVPPQSDTATPPLGETMGGVGGSGVLGDDVACSGGTGASWPPGRVPPGGACIAGHTTVKQRAAYCVVLPLLERQ